MHTSLEVNEYLVKANLPPICTRPSCSSVLYSKRRNALLKKHAAIDERAMLGRALGLTLRLSIYYIYMYTEINIELVLDIDIDR